MTTFDQSIVGLFEAGMVTLEAALLAGSDKAQLAQMLDRIRSARGERVTDIEGLALDTDYGRELANKKDL
jgi:twitching motility protein PilT